jgi:hypothetical protein
VTNEDLSLERDRLTSDCRAEAEKMLMTQEPEKGGTIEMLHNNSGIEENAPA